MKFLSKTNWSPVLNFSVGTKFPYFQTPARTLATDFDAKKKDSDGYFTVCGKNLRFRKKFVCNTNSWTYPYDLHLTRCHYSEIMDRYSQSIHRNTARNLTEVVHWKRTEKWNLSWSSSLELKAMRTSFGMIFRAYITEYNIRFWYAEGSSPYETFLIYYRKIRANEVTPWRCLCNMFPKNLGTADSRNFSRITSKVRVQVRMTNWYLYSKRSCLFSRISQRFWWQVQKNGALEFRKNLEFNNYILCAMEKYSVLMFQQFNRKTRHWPGVPVFKVWTSHETGGYRSILRVYCYMRAVAQMVDAPKLEE